MNSLIRWNPMRELVQMQNEFERMFDESVNRSFTNSLNLGQTVMPIDIVENDDQFVVKADLPSIDPDDLDITVADDVLTISGEWHDEELNDNEQYQLRERRYGRFSRSINLSVPVEVDQIDASYENGTLTLHVPKSERVRPKKISVKTSIDGQKMLGN